MADKEFKYSPLENDDALDAARKRDSYGEAPEGSDREPRFGKDKYEINVQSGNPAMREEIEQNEESHSHATSGGGHPRYDAKGADAEDKED